MKDAALGAVLRKVLARVRCTTGATYVLRKQGIEITTEGLVHAEFYRHRSSAPGGPEDDPNSAACNRQFAPLVQVEFNNVPLEKALQELSAQTDVNIDLDKRASNQADDTGAMCAVKAGADGAVAVAGIAVWRWFARKRS
jgi:hypothetical protein